MKIAMLQVPIVENVLSNLSWVKENSSNHSDVLILPEMWNCPYQNKNMKEAIAYQEESIQLLKDLSLRNKQVVIGGSIPYQENGKIYNACFIFDQGKQIAKYYKMHLMTFHGKQSYSEVEVFSPGNSFVTFEIQGVKVGILLCYDIRFPQPSTLLANKGVQILFLPAAFNQQVRKKHWEILLRTRALDNQFYVCGVNPSYTYQSYHSDGHSMIVNPDGQIIHEMNDQVALCETDIDLACIKKIRNRMPYASIQRNDLYKGEEYEKNFHQ